MGEIIPAPEVRPQDEIGFARVRDGQPKDVKAAQVMTVILGCNREHKYPAGDPRRECHLGFQHMDLDKCSWCVWFNSTTGQRSQLLTGGQAIALTGMLRSLRQQTQERAGEVELRENGDAAQGL